MSFSSAPLKPSSATMLSQYQRHSAPIYVQHIAVIQQNNLRKIRGYEPRGEYEAKSITPARDLANYKNELNSELLKRMVDYLKSITDIAAEKHKKNHCIPNTNELRADRKNHITRLVMHEFALYPHQSRRPFSVTVFNWLLAAIAKMAIALPENLQLVIGTLPIIVNNELKNVGFFVQCGKRLQIDAFAKYYPYADTLSKLYDPFCDPDTSASSVNNTQPTIPIHAGANFHYTTAGQAKGNLVIDICGDFYSQVGWYLVNKAVDQHVKNSKQFYPESAEHLIISNVLDTAKSDIISESVFIADPHHANPRSAYKNIADAPQHDYIRDQQVENTVEIAKPAFGSHTTLAVFQQRLVQQHIAALHTKISAANQTLYKPPQTSTLPEPSKQKRKPSQTIAQDSSTAKVRRHSVTLFANTPSRSEAIKPVNGTFHLPSIFAKAQIASADNMTSSAASAKQTLQR